MTIRKVVKLFIPPILLYFFHAIKKLARPTNDSFYSTIHLHKKELDTIFVLGNGPSLKYHLDNAIGILAKNICICVNHFVSTEPYTKIKPKIYMLIDPNLFSPVSVQEIEQDNLLMWENLRIKTTWNMDLIVSSQYRSNERIRDLSENKNINILFINLSDYYKYRNKQEQFALFNENKIYAPAENVLNTALYLCIFWRYKNIVLIGADSSLHEDLLVDQKTNILFSANKHFYEAKKKILCEDVARTIPKKIHDQFYWLARVFEAYWLLREYATFNGVTIFNASSKSYIDAFERKSIDDIPLSLP
jgi:hypothetical protein